MWREISEFCTKHSNNSHKINLLKRMPLHAFPLQFRLNPFIKVDYGKVHNLQLHIRKSTIIFNGIFSNPKAHIKTTRLLHINPRAKAFAGSSVSKGHESVPRTFESLVRTPNTHTHGSDYFPFYCPYEN